MNECTSQTTAPIKPAGYYHLRASRLTEDVVIDATWGPVIDILGADEDDPQSEGEILELEDTEEDCAPRRVAVDPGAPTAEQVEHHRVDLPVPELVRVLCTWPRRRRAAPHRPSRPDPSSQL